MHLVLIAAAVLPALFLLNQIYRSDRLEKEPVTMLLGLVLCGVIATELASLAEQGGVWLLNRLFLGAFSSGLQGGGWRGFGITWQPSLNLYYLLFFFVVVAVSEEGIKYLLLRLRTWRSREFNCSFDGVVYAVTSSLGFALWENIQYVLRFGFLTAMARAVTAVPGHACFGVFMGAWYGSAKRWQQKGRVGRSRFSRWMAVLVPVLLHGLYDTIAADPTANTGWLFLPFVLLLFTSTLYLVRRSARNDSYL